MYTDANNDRPASSVNHNEKLKCIEFCLHSVNALKGRNVNPVELTYNGRVYNGHRL